MFELIQQKSLLLGNKNAIDALAQKDSARLLVISDSHGSSSAVHSILKHFGSTCDALCFCGDGSRDVLSVLANSLSHADFAKSIPPVVALAQGNGDFSSCVLHSSHPQAFSVPKSQFFIAAGKLVFVTHGHLYDVYYGTKELFHSAKRENAEIVLFGHTHIPYAKNEDDILILNPGSCARPRRNSVNSFAIITISPQNTTFQFYSMQTDEKTAHFAPYTPPQEEISLLWV